MDEVFLANAQVGLGTADSGVVPAIAPAHPVWSTLTATRSTRAQPLRLVPVVAVVAVSLICLAAAAGWQSGWVPLRDGYPGWASMKLVTAACLSTLAIALYIKTRMEYRLHPIVLIGCGLVAATALVNGLSYFTLSSFGLASLFGRGDTAGAAMSAATAVTVLTLVMGLIAGPRHRVVTEAIVLIGAAVPYVAMVGYLISAQGLYSFGPYGGMSIGAAVSCLLLAGGLLTVDESTWLRRLGARDDFGAVVVRRFVVPSLLLSPSLGYLARIGVSLGWWDASFAPVLIVTGTSLLSVALVGWVGVLLARLERQRLHATDVAAAASAGQSFQAAVFSASPDIITVLDLPAGLVVWSNGSIPARLGYSPETAAAIGNNPAPVLIVADDLPKYTASMAAAREAIDDEVIQSDFRMARQDGTIRWFSRRSAPLQRDENGRVTRIVGITRDITDEMSVQAALVESQNRFHQLVDTVTVGFVLRSLDPPAFLYVSPGFAKIFGFDPTSLAEDPGPAFRRVTHPDDDQWVQEQYWRKAAVGIAAQAEFRILRPDGEIRWISASSAPVVDPDGIVRRTANTIEDVTDRKRAEAAQHSADKLAQANSVKDEMLSRMSHELRTPLNAVLGFAQLMELDELSDTQRDSVRHILDGGHHLVGLVDDILDLTKIQSKALDLTTEPFPITELLAGTTALMQPVAVTGGITLTYDPGLIGALLVQADRRRLRQVLLNLLSNAVKFNRPGGRIEMTGRPIDDHLEITVTDTGRGISAADLPRLFTPFERLGAAAAGIDGTGLGLTLSRDLMEAMGGSLSVTSTQGVGSSFTAAVPLVHALT